MLLPRVYTAGLEHRIPSLQDLIGHKADLPVSIPESLPSETPKSEAVNSHQARYSDTGVHDTLHSNLPPPTMSFTQEPLPETLSMQTLERYGPNAPFRHRSLIRDWVERIFVHRGNDKLIEYNTTVEKATKRGGTWVLTLRKAAPDDSKNHWWQEEFDALVVASGHYNVPYVPDIPGLVDYEKRFPGSIQHSKHYRSPKDYEGKVT